MLSLFQSFPLVTIQSLMPSFPISWPSTTLLLSGRFLSSSFWPINVFSLSSKHSNWFFLIGSFLLNSLLNDLASLQGLITHSLSIYFELPFKGLPCVQYRIMQFVLGRYGSLASRRENSCIPKLRDPTWIHSTWWFISIYSRKIIVRRIWSLLRINKCSWFNIMDVRNQPWL